MPVGNRDPALQESQCDDTTGSDDQFEADHAGQQLGASSNAHVQQLSGQYHTV